MGQPPGNIGNPQSLNRYSYVLNDAVNLIDPLGLDICPDGNYGTVCVTAPVDPVPFAGAVGDGRGGSPQPPGGLPHGHPMSAELRDQSLAGLDLKELLRGLAWCIRELYGIQMRTFVPSAPGQNGNFVGRTTEGRMIPVENDVTQYSVLNLSVNHFLHTGEIKRIGGITDPKNPYLNYSANDLPKEFYTTVQVHELAHSLDRITSGTSSEQSAHRLVDCVRE